MTVAVVRIFGVYGPGQQDKLVPNLIQRIQTGREIIVDRNARDPNDRNGLQISLTYIDDMVSALVNLLYLDDGCTLNIAGPTPISIREVAYTLGDILGIAPVMTEGPRFREGNLIADTAKYMSLFPQSQFTPLDEGLTRLVQSVRKSTGAEDSTLP